MFVKLAELSVTLKLEEKNCFITYIKLGCCKFNIVCKASRIDSLVVSYIKIRKLKSNHVDLNQLRYDHHIFIGKTVSVCFCFYKI